MSQQQPVAELTPESVSGGPARPRHYQVFASLIYLCICVSESC